MAFVFSSMSGTSGITAITLAADENLDFNTIFSAYTLQNAKRQLYMGVFQKQYVPSGDYLIFQPSSANFGVNGGESYIKVFSNQDWELQCSDWIELGQTSGSGNAVVSYDVSVNTENVKRYGHISGYSLSDSSVTATTVVTQQWSIYGNKAIMYTSTNGRVVTPTVTSGWGAEIVSNTYQDGIGILLFSDDITEMPVSAFTGQNNLLTVMLPDSLNELPDFAFYRCSNLESANIPDSVSGIGRTFNLTNISAITIPHSVVRLGGMGFAGCPLREIVLPSSLVETGSYNFGGDPLVSVTIEEGITSLGAGNFNGCNKLTSINLPNSITLLHERCFFNCTGLTEIVIGSGMTEMRDSSFAYCSSLAVIYSYAENGPVLNGKDYSPNSRHTFYDTPSDVVVHIPVGSSYSNWKTDTYARRWTYIEDL